MRGNMEIAVFGLYMPAMHCLRMRGGRAGTPLRLLLVLSKNNALMGGMLHFVFDRR